MSTRRHRLALLTLVTVFAAAGCELRPIVVPPGTGDRPDSGTTHGGGTDASFSDVSAARDSGGVAPGEDAGAEDASASADVPSSPADQCDSTSSTLTDGATVFADGAPCTPFSTPDAGADGASMIDASADGATTDDAATDAAATDDAATDAADDAATTDDGSAATPDAEPATD